MTFDWYLCTQCHASIELIEGQHEFDPPCPKCGGKIHYVSSSDTASDTDLTRVRSHEDQDKINFDQEEAKRKFEQMNKDLDERRMREHAPHCPTCNSPNIEKIGVVGRAVSVGIFGLASNKIGKTFKCRNCGYTW